MTWKTILVPHDFSSCANHATAMARDVAKSHGARLVLLHVADLPLGLEPDAVIVPREGAAPLKARDVALGGAREHIENLAERLTKDGVQVTTALALGNVVDEIIEAARREQADLIVMGTNGRTGLSRLVVGSVTEKVVRQAPVPVLTLRDDDAK
jgi:nucleotide-binding universal stress UspA family protein